MLNLLSKFAYIILGWIKQRFDLTLFSFKFRKQNIHNRVIPINVFDINTVSIWKGTYGNLSIISFHEKGDGLKIWNYCSIVNDVEFILWGNHNMKLFSTYPFGVFWWVPWCEREWLTKGKITIGNDVWICRGARILSGVTIGTGAVIGAYSVITQDIPPYTIVWGTPAKVIRYRFSDEIITVLQEIDWDKLNPLTIQESYDKFWVIETLDDAKKIVSLLNK